ncbi:MAG: multifunctional CCA addition/repair protein [Legionella sp.]|nr:MAG: multifunctional CCA addition/repair protein [Legionella sp.]
MKIYLVGGAVRDQLLGLPIKERDWVVVGAEPQALLKLGYQQVGRDFPVFLHPKTREEYALARKEKKRGSGYYGFECDANSYVTLEEDLARRDLTINAMAMDSDGRLIDPYNGKKDLDARRLQHVSEAFVEDPVRVLRIARFMARFEYLGFEVAAETRVFMQRMVRDGELAHLVPERVWQEWQKSLLEKNPSAFIKTLRACGALKAILPEIDALFGVPSRVTHHPEIDTGIHTLMALDMVTQLSSDPILRFATVLHDLGKAATPIKHWPAQKNHDELGLPIIEQLCQRLAVPKRYQALALMVAQWHLHIHRVVELSAEKIVDIFDRTHAFRDPNDFEHMLLVCEADYRGRGISTTKKISLDYPPAQVWRIMLAECRKLHAKTWIDQGLVGVAIKEALHAARVACVTNIQHGN